VKLKFINEPELEFGSGGTHVDIRHGIMAHGPLDLGEATAPTQLRVGLVGTEQTITALRDWFEQCREGVPGKRSKLRNLFPEFPGFGAQSPFRCSLVFHDRWTATLRQRDIETVIAHSDRENIVRHAVDLFLDPAEDMVQQGGPMVILCIPPKDLLAAVDEQADDDETASETGAESDVDEGGQSPIRRVTTSRPFHDVLKAQGMRLAVPLQMVRPETYTGEPRPRRGKRSRPAKPLQDEATRAWNIHIALYYKAGGTPWRLLRKANDLTTCFIGVSFYKSLEGDRLMTSIAQVFNELGEGVIVKGGPAKLDKQDRQPHVSEEDARLLLGTAIETYRREHHNMPARIVLHKTSKLTDGEQDGFRAATDDARIDLIDLLALRPSFTRLFRYGTYPPLRGTFVELQPDTGLLYTRGSVAFFETYPGLYVPRALEFNICQAEAAPHRLATEMLSLSKLNWNNTQFDGGDPITVRAARRVGDILKCVQEGGKTQPFYRFFM
jgi:hypothetical protein